MPRFSKAVRRAGRRVRQVVGRALMFACVRGVGEEEDVERQMGLGFGLAGPLPRTSSSAPGLVRSATLLDLRRIGDGPGRHCIIEKPDDDLVSLCSIGDAFDLLGSTDDTTSSVDHGAADWDPSLSCLSPTGTIRTCSLASEQASFVTAFTNASDALYELAPTRWSFEVEQAASLQFTYLLQTQWFRDAPVERDAIQALYFAAGAAGSFVDVVSVVRR